MPFFFRRALFSRARSRSPLRSKPLLRFTRDYLWSYRLRLLVAACGLVLFSLTAFAQVRMLEPILDHGFTTENSSTLYWLMALMFSFSAVRALAYYLQTAQSGYIGAAVFRDLQNVLYRHLVTHDLSFMHRDATGKYVALMTANMHLIRNSLSRVFITLLRDGVLAAAYLFNMLYTNWKMSLMTLFFVVLLFVPIRWLSRLTRHAAQQTQKKIGDVGRFVDESFKGLRQIKSYNAEESRLRFALGQFQDLFSWNKRTSYAQAKALPIVELLIGLAFACVVLIGGLQIREGATSVGGIMSFVVALLLMLQPVRSLVNMNIDVQEGIAALQSFYFTLEEKPRIRDRKNATTLRVSQAALEFRKVCFAYDAEADAHQHGGKISKGVVVPPVVSPVVPPVPPALRDLSFVVKGGTKAAVVGASGAGKSTLVNVLLRLYDIDSGAILIDGQNTADCTLHSLRSHIAYVSQDVGIFNANLRENIALGVERIDEARLRRAVADAEAEGFIAQLPRGLETEVGERGFRLSGGQQQRIALARALYKDASIVVLDEATAALDNETERLLQRTLDRVMHGRTVLTIAHRLTTIRNADCIYVLERGACLERGNHHHLLQKGGKYAQLWNRMASDEEKETGVRDD